MLRVMIGDQHFELSLSICCLKSHSSLVQSVFISAITYYLYSFETTIRSMIY